MSVYLFNNKNAFTIAYIIILKDTCAKSTCHKIAIIRTLMTKWPIHRAKKSMFFCSPPLPINTPSQIKIQSSWPLSPQIEIPLSPLPPKSKYITTPLPQHFNKFPAVTDPSTFISGISLMQYNAALFYLWSLMLLGFLVQ